MFIGLGLSGVIPVIHCVSIYGYSVVMDRMAVNWIILHGVMYIFGAVLYAVCVSRTTSTKKLSMRLTITCRYGGPKGLGRARLTSGEVRTRFSTFLSSWLALHTCMPCRGPLIFTTPSWLLNVCWSERSRSNRANTRDGMMATSERDLVGVITCAFPFFFMLKRINSLITIFPVKTKVHDLDQS